MPPQRRSATPPLLILAVLAFAADPIGSDRVTAQSASPTLTTVSALLTHSTFFHARRVVVRGEIASTEDFSTLVVGSESVQILRSGQTSEANASGIEVELRGTFWDVGRIEPDDPRLAEYDVQTVAMATLGKDWPAVGELLGVTVDAVEPTRRFPAPSIRALALEPGRYVNQAVTVVGRFRGRNLYGDLPEAPSLSEWDFVLQSAGGAVWITGHEPKGDGFHLDIDARVDTGKWLEVAGTVNRGRGLVWLDATRIATSEPQVTTAPPTAALPQEPPPEVIFSAPVQDETDVARDTSVRIQFSRDMDPDSFEGRVRVSYLGAESIERGEPGPPALGIVHDYARGRRVLEVVFTTELDRFRTMRVELLEGIQARDGLPLPPWTLTFSLGGS